MKKFGARKFFGLLAIMLTILACDTSDVIALLGATPTPIPTRTPRATFTPRPPDETATPEATATVNKTPTRVAVATARPPTAKPATAAPVAPQFPVTLTESYPCPQTAAVYEIAARIQDPNPPKRFLGDYVIEIRSPDGSFNKIGLSVPSGQEYATFLGGTDCRAANFWPYNVKVDAAEVRGQGPFLVRIVRSDKDRTPISADVTVDFKQPTRWIIYYFAPPK